jgi:hypothetical protein
MTSLYLDDNPIVDIEWLAQVNMVSIKNLYLEWKNSPVIGNDLSWILKLKKIEKLKGLETIAIQSKYRVEQRRIVEMLGKKYRVPPPALVKLRLT